MITEHNGQNSAYPSLNNLDQVVEINQSKETYITLATYLLFVIGLKQYDRVPHLQPYIKG